MLFRMCLCVCVYVAKLGKHEKRCCPRPDVEVQLTRFLPPPQSTGLFHSRFSTYPGAPIRFHGRPVFFTRNAITCFWEQKPPTLQKPGSSHALRSAASIPPSTTQKIIKNKKMQQRMHPERRAVFSSSSFFSLG